MAVFLLLSGDEVVCGGGCLTEARWGPAGAGMGPEGPHTGAPVPRLSSDPRRMPCVPRSRTEGCHSGMRAVPSDWQGVEELRSKDGFTSGSLQTRDRITGLALGTYMHKATFRFLMASRVPANVPQPRCYQQLERKKGPSVSPGSFQNPQGMVPCTCKHPYCVFALRQTPIGGQGVSEDSPYFIDLLCCSERASRWKFCGKCCFSWTGLFIAEGGWDLCCSPCCWVMFSTGSLGS